MRDRTDPERDGNEGGVRPEDFVEVVVDGRGRHGESDEQPHAGDRRSGFQKGRRFDRDNSSPIEVTIGDAVVRIAPRTDRVLLNIGAPVAINVSDGNLSPGAAIVVDQMWNKVDAPVIVPDLLKPVENRRRIGLGILIDSCRASMPPPTLSGHDILHSVTIDIFKCDCLQLRKRDAMHAFAWLPVHDHTPFELEA